MRMIFIGSMTRRILARSLIRPVPERIWKFICARRLNMRKNAENFRIVPDIANFSVKRRILSSSQNWKKKSEIHTAIIEK